MAEHATENGGVAVPAWSVGDRVRKARREAGLSSGQLARALHVTESTISRWEHDHVVPPAAKLVLVALVCRVPVWWLLGVEPGEAEEWSNEAYAGSLSTRWYALRGWPQLAA